MATIDQLTHAAVLDENMRIPISLFGQTLYVTLGQILAAQNILTLTEYSPDGLDGHWHAEYAATDNYIRISTDGGNTWGPAINLRDPAAQPGADSLYTWMKFADTATPQTSADIYDEPRDATTAIGWAYNKTTPEESDNPADYMWVRFKGADAAELDAVQEYYAVGASSTLPPAGGWVEVPKNAMPAMTAADPYLWNYERSTYNNGAYRDTQPRCVGRRGDDGTSITKVTDYYLASAKETGVTTADDGWTTLIASAEASWGASLPYLWNYEKREWSNGYVDYVQPHRIARWANDGASGQGSVNSYVFCLSAQQPATPTGGSYTSLVPDGWSDGFPSDPEDDNFGLSVWMSRRLFTSDGLPPQESEWTEPVLFGNNSHQQIMYSTADEQPPSPAVDESAWDDEASRETVWMAMRHRVNAIKNPGWSDWSIIRIKGEKGKDMPDVDRGQWLPGDKYFAGSFNPATLRQEISHVWNAGCKYRCLVDGAIEAPSWDSQEWEFEEGDPDLRLELVTTNTLVNALDPLLDLEVSARIYNQDVTTSTKIRFDWTRESYFADTRAADSDAAWDAAHADAGPALSMSEDDMGFSFGNPPDKLVYIVTATLTLSDSRQMSRQLQVQIG